MKLLNAKIINRRGFVALILSVTASILFLMMASANANAIAALFDEAYHKEYRFLATKAAVTCLDQAVQEITHDYFYINIFVNTSVSYPDRACSIDGVYDSSPPVGSSKVIGPYRTIAVRGIAPAHVVAYITAQVLIGDGTISLLSATTTF